MSLSKLLADLRSPSATTESDATTDAPRDDGPRTLGYECRRCGTNVSQGTRRCPACDATDIATYALE